MSFKMDFFNKWVEQMRGLFQNQRNAATATGTLSPLDSNTENRTGGGSSGRPMTAPVTNSSPMVPNSLNYQPKASAVQCPSFIPLAHVLPTTTTTTTNHSTTNNMPNQATPTGSAATKTSSPESTGSSGASIGGGGGGGGGSNSAIMPSPFHQNTTNHNNYSQHQHVSHQHSAASFFSNNNHSYHPHSSYNKNHNYHHHHHYHQQQPNQHQPPPPPLPLPLHQQYGHYPTHPHQQRSLDHNQSSTSSSSTSFGPIPLTPSFSTPSYNRNENFSGLGNRSYSAINTPDSPVNFRRQNSLNVNQRQASSRLQLDFRSQKNSPLYAKQSASTDLIDKHSLSPRPRPKDLSLSNSQDNMLRGGQNHVVAGDGGGFASRFGDGFGGQQPPPSSTPGGGGTSSNHQTPFHQPRPGGLSMNPYSQQNGPRSGSTSSTSSVFTSNRIELTRNSSSINLNGTKYDRLEESHFKHISELGAGSFGQVDKMLHIPSNTELAVKKMRRSGNVDDIRHVHRDLNLLQMCNYEHVVQCYGYFILETEVWIFMELMTTCFDHLIKNLREKNETVPERIIGKVAVATIDTLHYLKTEHKIIHRDIKPSNILINRQGIIKLCDFGISGMLVNSRAHTRSVGSVAYRAPERIEPPKEGGYDVRSDIWSMGISLVEIAIGRFPYQDWKSDFEILTKVIHEEPPTLPDSLEFSDDFHKFIEVCLTKDYTKRPKYPELMNHPFYKHYKTATVDVAEWFNKVWPENR